MLDQLCSIHLIVPETHIKIDWIDHPQSLGIKPDWIINISGISGMTPYVVKCYFLWDKISAK